MAETDSLILRPSKKRWGLMLLGSSAFVAAGIFLLRHDGPGGKMVAWISILFFGLCMLVSILMLIPGSNALVLTPEGFSLKTFGFTRTVWIMKWQDIGNFSVLDIRSHMPLPWLCIIRPKVMMIGLTYTPSARAEMSPRRVAGMNRLRLRFGCDGALPDTYGMSAENLVALLNEWRTKYSI